MREVADNLYVGDARDALETHEHFDAVVSMACVGSYTTHGFPIQDGPHDYDEFERAVDTVRRLVYEEGRKTLVHCQAGISRSVCVATAAIAVEEGTSFDTAYQRTRTGFMSPSNEVRYSATKYITREKLK